MWSFTRPHTLIGSALSIPALHIFAAPAGSAVVQSSHLLPLLFAWIPSLLINIYIVGLNQLTDVSIDRINKPELPLASGALKQWQGWVICLASLVLGLGGAFALRASPHCSMPLLQTLVLSALIGTAYSLEPIRLKRFPTAAALCILTVRGTIINVGFMAHSLATCFGGGESLVGNMVGGLWALPFSNFKCGMATLYFAVFGAVIALMKDIPDIVGDKAHNIKSFTVRLGATRVFAASTTLLCSLLAVAGGGILGTAWLGHWGALVSGGSGVVQIVTAPTAFTTAARTAVGLAALAAAIDTRGRSKQVTPSIQGEVYGFYMHIWKLFYASYLALLFVR